MPSELDRRLSAIMDQLTTPGGPLETASVHRDGVTLPVFRDAPPSLPAFFARYCAKHGDLAFLVDGDVRLSFAETCALAESAARGLIARHGVKRGDNVGIAARNSAGWIIAYMAVLMAGGCATLLNGWWKGSELAQAIRLAGCALVLADPERARRLEEESHGARVVVFGHGDPRAGLTELLGGDASLPEVTAGEHATIVFTSGSTGVSKGALSDHRGVVQAALSFAAQTLMVYTHLAAEGSARQGQPSTLVTVPLFHVTGEVAVFLQSFVIGRRLVMMPRWDAIAAMRLIEQERITYFVGVPLMSHEIATHPERGKYDLSSCRNFAAGGAPRPVDHVARIREALPHAFPLLGYGLTETNAVGCGNYNENYLAKPASTGPASRPLVELAVFDENGRPLPAGQAGEVAIRSICNFIGYWQDPEATAAALRRDGWFLTGDVGWLDEDGYLFIMDRKKDIILRGGENIACLEVEQAIYAHPAVSEASVFGLPDARLGEVPVAVYLTRAGHALEEEELRAFVSERIASFKLPVLFWQVQEALPRLGTEKVDKRALKVRYSEEWEAAKAGT